jgi:hypothetical protein
VAISYFATDDFRTNLFFAVRYFSKDSAALKTFSDHANRIVTTYPVKLQDVNQQLEESILSTTATYELITEGKHIYRIGNDLYDVLRNGVTQSAKEVYSLLNNIQDGHYIIELPYTDTIDNMKVKAITMHVNKGNIHVNFLNGVIPASLGINASHADMRGHDDNLKTKSMLVNIALYLNYGSDDLVSKIQPIRITKDRPNMPKHLRHKYEFNSIMVGFNYKKPKRYYVDGCEVSGHFRWQPHGEGRSKIKLIFIEPYTKVFNNKES